MQIVLLSAEGTSATKIMRRTGKVMTDVWCCQEHFAEEGYEGLLGAKTRSSRNPPLGPEVEEHVVPLTPRD